MSREIKFRCWSEKEKAYLDGPGRFLWVSHDDTTSGLYSPTDLQITLEQYTGLKDKNGKDLYDGDIVEIGKYGKFQIIWNEWACKFDFDKIGKREREEPLLSQDWEQKAEVIGNIHENPELLGGEE